jgi:hypothetical protein
MAHPAPFYDGYQASSSGGLMGWDVALTTSPQLPSNLAVSTAIPLFPLCAPCCMLWDDIYIHNSLTADTETS